MNETAGCSDGSDSENQQENKTKRIDHHIIDSYSSLPASSKSVLQDAQSIVNSTELDFFTKQARLQVEARAALAQAKELARDQMLVERQQKKRNLMSDLVRISLEKVGTNYSLNSSRFFQIVKVLLFLALLDWLSI